MKTKTTRTELIISLLLAGASFAPSFQVLSKDNAGVESPTGQTQVILEVILYCQGMCGTPGNKDSLRLHEDRTAEYRTSRSADPTWDRYDEVLQDRRIILNTDEFDELMTLVESVAFKKSKAHYANGVSLIDASYITSVSYRRGSTLKTVSLKNYYPGQEPSRDDPPAEIREIIRKGFELISRIQGKS